MIISVIIMIIFAISVWVFIRENEKAGRTPSVYGWSIFLLASTLALASFFADGGEATVEKAVAGILYVGNTLCIIIIVAYLLLKKEKNLSVNWLDKFSLIASTAIVLFWILSNNAYHANIALQTLMTMGYVVLINNLYKQKKCEESFFFWALVLFISVLSFIPAYAESDSLAVINSWRSTVSSAIVLAFMTYYWRQSVKNNLNLEVMK